MSLKGKSGARAAMLVAVIASVLFCISCGDEFRPVANPILQPGGDPQRTSHVLAVSSNGAARGSALIIDVSGDTAAALFSEQSCIQCGVGRNPVHATSLGGIDFVVNRADDSLSYFFLPTPPTGNLNPPNLVPLATGASPVFAAVAQSSLYVAETGRNSLAVVTSNAVSGYAESGEIPVGADPVALVATPDSTELYSLNQGDNTVSVIFPAINQNVQTIALPAGATPVWGAVSSDGTRVFVVNQGTGTVSEINTVNNSRVPGTAPCTVDTFCVGPAPNYIVYEPILNRAYVTSPSGNSVSIIDNNLSTVQTVSLAGAPCNGQHPISVTALADGTRVYVADDAANSVCVLDTKNNTFTKRICLVQEPAATAPPTAPCVGSATPISITSNSDATRVYTANQYQTAPVGIASITRQNFTNPTTGLITGVVTVTTSAGVPFVAGHPVTVTVPNDASFSGVFGITSVISATQFTYVQIGLSNSTPDSTGATVAILPYVSLIQTSDNTLVINGNEATDNTSLNLVTPPLTISAGGTPSFMVMTP